MNIAEVQGFIEAYNEIKDSKMPVRTTYKFVKIAKWCEEQNEFYRNEMKKILDEYAQKDDDGNYKYSEDRQQILLIPETTSAANAAFEELSTMDFPFEGNKFTIDELETLEIAPNTLIKLFSFISD